MSLQQVCIVCSNTSNKSNNIIFGDAIARILQKPHCMHCISCGSSSCCNYFELLATADALAQYESTCCQLVYTLLSSCFSGRRTSLCETSVRFTAWRRYRGIRSSDG